MKLCMIPFDGLFIVYDFLHEEKEKLFHGFSPYDIPKEYEDCDVVSVYPCDDSIIVEIKVK